MWDIPYTDIVSNPTEEQKAEYGALGHAYRPAPVTDPIQSGSTTTVTYTCAHYTEGEDNRHETGSGFAQMCIRDRM